ncbi:MAG: cytochrome c-type biogenesis protein [Trueperaceae bacterium]
MIAYPSRLYRRGAAPWGTLFGTLLAVVLLTGVAGAQEAAPPGAAGGGAVELESNVFEIGRQLRCPTCVSQSVADSNSAIATEMRTEIRELLQDGRTEREVLALYRERYGDWILLEPPREGIHLLVWALPAIAVGLGVAALVLLMVRWTRASRAAAREAPPDPAQLARVRAELAGDANAASDAPDAAPGKRADR